MDVQPPKCVTPEQLIKEMSVAEVQELLDALAMDASTESAMRLQQLVKTTNCLEAAINSLCSLAVANKAA